MVLDLRGFCSIDIGGTTFDNVISLATTEDSLVGNGLIKSSGNAVFADPAQRPKIGKPVTITYSVGDPSNSNIITHPRKYFVTGSSIGSNGKTLNVTFADTLTINSNLAERVEILENEDDDPESDEPKVVTNPIPWQRIFNKCLNALGIGATYVGTNPFQQYNCNFSVEKFSLESGYVQVISDMLLSLGRIGYMNNFNTLVVEDITTYAGQQVVVTANDLVEIQGFNNNGEIPAQDVDVTYAYVQLSEPEEQENPEEEDITIFPFRGYCNTIETKGSKKEISFEQKDRNGRQVLLDFESYPYSVQTDCYDKYFRQISSTTVNYKKMAEFMQGAYANIARGCNPNRPSEIKRHGDTYVKEVTERKIKYDSNTRGKSDNDDFNDPILEIDRVYRSEAEILSALDIRNQQAEKAIPLILSIYYSSNLRLVSRTEKEFERKTESTSITVREVNKTTNTANLRRRVVPINITIENTKEYALQSTTDEGQRIISELSEAGFHPIRLKQEAFKLVFIRAEKRKSTVLDVSRVRSPIAENTPDDADPNNDYRTEKKSQIKTVEGAAQPGDAGRLLTLQMPYAPDDTFKKVGSGENVSYSVTKSKAPSIAKQFGKTQLKLLRGEREGVTLFGDPRAFPTRPGSQVAINLNGIIASFITSGVQITMNDRGIIGSLDCIYNSIIGFSNDPANPLEGQVPWITIPDGVTLPNAPAIGTFTPNIIGSIEDVNAP